MDYTQHFSTKQTPQTRPIPGRADMVKNSAQGYSFQASDWTRLDRFLMLGTEGGTYYANEGKLTVENAQVIVGLIKVSGKAVVNRITEVSLGGLAPKNDPAIFALALACTFGDPETKKIAYAAISNVCRTGTHLFTFCESIKKLRGWSRGLRKGVARYYEARQPGQIAHQMMKYRQRNGWTHRDVIRLSHPKFPIGSEGCAWRALGKEWPKRDHVPVPVSWLAFEAVQKLTAEKSSVKLAVDLVKKHDLPWEAVPTDLHKFPELWEAMLPTMGYTALLRNLSRLSKLGLISEHGFDGPTKLIAERFANVDELRKSRLHPITILNGMLAYGLGYSQHKATEKWLVSQKICMILEEVYYKSYQNVVPTGLNHLLALDVSGSMSGPMLGKTALTPRMASTAMAMVTMNAEPMTHVMGFSTSFMPLAISKTTRLGDAVRYTEGLPFSGTDCSLPMLWAIKHKAPIDVFVVYTDSETFAGRIHPTQALEQYRQTMGRNAKLVVVGMTSNGFTIADPKDPRQLDVVGFSLETPRAISSFAKES